MAPLIDAARSARLEAQRLRVEERRLKTDMRAKQTVQREMMAAAAARVAPRDLTLPSPWSTLLWLHADEQLDQTLVPVR